MVTDWDAIVADYGPVVWKTAYRLLGNHADAADCYQDVWLEATRGRPVDVRSWPAFLKRVTTARALDRLRQRIRQRDRTAADPQWQLVKSTDSGPVEYAQASELVVRLRDALAQIPPDQAEVFVLRSMESLSYDEIARQMQITTSAVGVLLHRARERLQPFFAEAQARRA